MKIKILLIILCIGIFAAFAGCKSSQINSYQTKVTITSTTVESTTVVLPTITSNYDETAEATVSGYMTENENSSIIYDEDGNPILAEKYEEFTVFPN